MNKKTTSSKAATSNHTSSKATSKAAPKKITQEQIAMRAYFISEQRQKTGREGDHLSDWMEAEKQLMAENSK